MHKGNLINILFRISGIILLTPISVLFLIGVLGIVAACIQQRPFPVLMVLMGSLVLALFYLGLASYWTIFHQLSAGRPIVLQTTRSRISFALGICICLAFIAVSVFGFIDDHRVALYLGIEPLSFLLLAMAYNRLDDKGVESRGAQLQTKGLAFPALFKDASLIARVGISVVILWAVFGAIYALAQLAGALAFEGPGGMAAMLSPASLFNWLTLSVFFAPLGAIIWRAQRRQSRVL